MGLHLSATHDRVILQQQTKGSNSMAILTIGQEFVTQKSGVKGTIKEIVQNPSGSVRVRLDVKGKERWTTIEPQFKVLSVAS